MDFDKIVEEADHIVDSRVKASGPWNANSRWTGSYTLPLTHTSMTPYVSKAKLKALFRRMPKKDLEWKYATEAVHFASIVGEAEVRQHQCRPPPDSSCNIICQGAATGPVALPRRSKKIVSGRTNAQGSSVDYNIMAHNIETRPAWNLSEWRSRMRRRCNWDKITSRVATTGGRGRDHRPSNPIPIVGMDNAPPVAPEAPGDTFVATPATPSAPITAPMETKATEAKVPQPPVQPRRPANAQWSGRRPRPASAVQSASQPTPMAPRAARPKSAVYATERKEAVARRVRPHSAVYRHRRKASEQHCELLPGEWLPEQHLRE